MAVRSELLAEGQSISVVRLCRWLQVPHSTAYYLPRHHQPHRPVDETLAGRIRELIRQFPTFGIRRVWAYLRFRLGQLVNRKKVARLMRLKGWTMARRRVGGRPRVRGSRSIAPRPNQRWATDVALVFCGPQDGWCSFVPVVDCCTREVLGWQLAHTARAKTAERALEEALIGRFGWVRGAPADLRIRHDNGLVFGSRLYRACVRDYGLSQEYITPYTPEDNGLVERFVRSFKEECVWQHRFESLDQAHRTISHWIDWYNADRPHQALNYQTPKEHYRTFQTKCA